MPLFTTLFTEYFKPTVKIKKKKKMIPFKIYLLLDLALGHSRTLMEMYREIYVVLMTVNEASMVAQGKGSAY